MDMKVDTHAFTLAEASIKKHVEKICAITEFLIKRIERARAEFDDINYRRTLEALKAVKRSTYNLEKSKEDIKSDLRTLESLVNEYLCGGYRR